MGQNLDQLTDEQLLERSRGTERDEQSLETLFRRYYPKIAYWCLRVAGDPVLAEDIAQEVCLRLHTRLGSFRMESRFSTWLYTLTRRVAINHLTHQRRRAADSLDEESRAEQPDDAPNSEELASRRELSEQLRRTMSQDLEPTEARVLYLHYVDGMTLSAITDLLELENKSGAKAFVQSGRRKLKRGFGRWLGRQASGGAPG